MDDQTSIYSFTSYNTSHYTDISNRLHHKVNSYALEINQKVHDDNQSLHDMEEGIIALSNYLNGVEEKRPSVSELIGSRINLDDCLKLKLEIREKIRKTKKIRTDLFTSTLESPRGSQKPKSEINSIRMTPQTSRVMSPKETSRMPGHLSQPESDSQSRQQTFTKSKPKPIETSKSLSSIPLSTPKSLPSAKTLPVNTDQQKSISDTLQEKRHSQSNDTLTTPFVKTPLITPLLPTSVQKQKSLGPIDDLADRQLAWLLNIEARNRQARQALEAQSIREVICMTFHVHN